MSFFFFLFLLLLFAVVCERVAELLVSRNNARWSFARGGVEYGRGHYPAMVVLHAGLLAGCVVEPWLLARPFVPWIGYPALALVVAAQGLRWWVIRALGHRWNTRVIVVPGGERVTSGPFRWLRHPNYLAVVVEGVALPMVHTAWITALGFSVLNAALLRVRIGTEEEALGSLRPRL